MKDGKIQYEVITILDLKGFPSREILFTGTELECRIFMDAYLLAVVIHTSYTHDTRGMMDNEVFVHSPLVSQDNFWISIVKK
jgi:hypothetical protein